MDHTKGFRYPDGGLFHHPYRLYRLPSRPFFRGMAWFVWPDLGQSGYYPFHRVSSLSCLDWRMDYLHRLRKMLRPSLYFEFPCSSHVGRLLLLGHIDIMECLIDESRNAHV